MSENSERTRRRGDLNPDELAELDQDRFCRRSAANVDLWPPSGWSYSELTTFRRLVKSTGIDRVSGQISSDIRGLELQIIIAFVSGAIAAGFLDALGSDLYDGLKAGLKRLLLKHEASASQNEEPLGRLTIEYPPHVPTFLRDQPPALEVEFLCVFYSAEDLEGFLSTLPRASKLVEEAWSSKLFPFDIDSYRYSVSLEPGMSGCRVNITRRSDSDTTPKITESCLVYLDARKLTLEHWREEFRSMLLRRTAPNSKAVTRVTKDAK